MTEFLNRKSEFPIEMLILSRFSSRAFSEERLTEAEILSFFEAARWAPSAHNNQPWRFIYVRRGEEGWDIFFNALSRFNKGWCKNADTLALILSRNTFELTGEPLKTNHFDAGAAWMNLALEVHAKKCTARAIGDFDYEAVKKNLHIPDQFNIEIMVAIGKQGKREDLPEALREGEQPTTRKPLSNIVSKAKFSFDQ